MQAMKTMMSHRFARKAKQQVIPSLFQQGPQSAQEKCSRLELPVVLMSAGVCFQAGTQKLHTAARGQLHAKAGV